MGVVLISARYPEKTSMVRAGRKIAVKAGKQSAPGVDRAFLKPRMLGASPSPYAGTSIAESRTSETDTMNAGENHGHQGEHCPR
ncbi:hypothetical protein GCM10027612_07790 [Microbispora bryophytorum subsp. camponoti]